MERGEIRGAIDGIDDPGLRTAALFPRKPSSGKTAAIRAFRWLSTGQSVAA